MFCGALSIPDFIEMDYTSIARAIAALAVASDTEGSTPASPSVPAYRFDAVVTRDPARIPSATDILKMEKKEGGRVAEVDEVS
jgi:hypothetical protein